VAAALKEVRQEMGSDATVLRTRRLKGGKGRGQIEITACTEKKPSATQATAVLHETAAPVRVSGQAEPRVSNPEITLESTVSNFSEEAAFNRDDRIERIERKLDQLSRLAFLPQSDLHWYGILEHIYRQLKEADLPSTHLDPFMSSLLDEYDDRRDSAAFVHKKLANDLSSMMLAGLRFKPGDKVIFLGPPGAGKSSVMGKLATQLVVQDRKKVKLASLDYHKIAAHEELSSYAEILQVKVTDPFGNATDNNDDGDAITLIDAPPLSPDQQTIDNLKEKIERINPNYRLAVFSALTRSSDIKELAERLKPLLPTHIVVTMLDLTAHHGSAVAAAKVLGGKITFITDSPGGVGQVKTLDPDSFAHSLLNMDAGLEWTTAIIGTKKGNHEKDEAL